MEIKNLMSFKEYCIKVAAFNRKGQGALSNDVCVYIDDGGRYLKDPSPKRWLKIKTTKHKLHRTLYLVITTGVVSAEKM